MSGNTLDKDDFEMTPLHIEILMHYYTRGKDMENLSARTVSEYIQQLLDAGMLRFTDTNSVSRFVTYEITERGKVWLEALLRVPFPVQKWEVQWPLP